MLAGFLAVWPRHLPLFGIARSDTHLRFLEYRFPRIKWLLPNQAQPKYTCWLGIGDTPIQVLSGLGFLESLENEFQQIPKDVVVGFIGIGAEHEAIRFSSRFKAIVERSSFITTRDVSTADFIVHQLGFSGKRIEVGSDLAHISLRSATERLSKWPLLHQYELGINIYQESMSRVQAGKLFWHLQKASKQRRIAYLCNEIRTFKNSELDLLQRFGWLLNLVNGRSIEVVAPNRGCRTTIDSVRHFLAFEQIASSRYHCLLTAAWLQIAIIGISRSSKILGLANELNFDILKPRDLESYLTESTRASTTVLQSILKKNADNALEGTRWAIGTIVEHTHT